MATTKLTTAQLPTRGRKEGGKWEERKEKSDEDEEK
jgi:hypothetical protein